MLKLNFILLTILLFSCSAGEEQVSDTVSIKTKEVNDKIKQTVSTNSSPEVERNEEERIKERLVDTEPKSESAPEKKRANSATTGGKAKQDSVPVSRLQMSTKIIAGLEASAANVQQVFKNDKKDALHELFDAILLAYVSPNGKVNYKGLKSNPSQLNQYLEKLQNNPVKKEWSEAKKLAYWINTYNAFTLKRIIDNYPLKSIMNLDSGKTWDVKWIKLGSKMYSLNMIEHQIIRPKFNDARIHFAVNCAAKSCPPLYNKAYTEDNLDRLLEQRTKAFINNSNYNTINTNNLKISKIFEWYADDFGNLVTFLNAYSKTTIAKDAKITYKEYDWSLNEQ